MLKISEGKPAKRSVSLRLEGRLIGPWVSELRQICEPLLGDNSQIELELAEVTFVDEQGVALLTSLEARGVRLLSAAPFVRQQLRSAKPG